MRPITHIVHLADIHIRAGDVNQSRQDEYMNVFWNLAEQLDALPCVHNGTALCVVCGDVFHHKYRLEGPAVKMWTEFIHTLTDRMDVVIISGNHDFRQERPDDPDLLEVMIGTLPPLRHKCHYVRDTQVLECFDGLDIGVVAIRETLDSLDTSGLVTELPEFPLPRRENTIKLALFHGTITQSSLPNGQRMSTGKGYPLEWFKGYDMVLLGDNHQQQWYSKKGDMPAWGYPGSLVQQDFGEPVYGHGFLLWDVTNQTATAYHVTNERARIRAKIIDGEVMFKWSPTSYYTTVIAGSDFPCNPIVQVIGQSGDDHIVAKYLHDINVEPTQLSCVIQFQYKQNERESDSEQYAIEEIHNQEVWIDYLKRMDPDLAVKLAALQWIQSPEKIIGSVDIDVVNLPLEIQTKIKERTERIHQALDVYRQICDATSKVNDVNLVYLEWSWAFAYGEANWFNFQTLDHDIALLNGKNASGKSSFIDILCIALFGEPGKNRNINSVKRMNSLMIHHQKPARVPMSCSVVFDVDGERYTIERVYTTHKTKTDEYGIQMSKCELYRNTELICSGATLVDGWVRKHCGTIEDMMESSIVSQMDIHNFFMLKPDQQKNRIDESLNMESLKAFGAVVQQSILAYNLWIESLSTYIQSQQSATLDMLDISDDINIPALEQQVASLFATIEEKERYCYDLMALCPEENTEYNIDDADNIDIPTNIAERRGALRKDIEEFIDLLPSYEEALAVINTVNVATYSVKQPRPLSELRQLRAATEQERNEWDKWQKTVPWVHEIEAHDYDVTCDDIYDDYIRMHENVAKTNKPIRDEEKYNEWKDTLQQWKDATLEAIDNEWPSSVKCKKMVDKCQSILAKWDAYEQEKNFLRSSYDESRKTWKQERVVFKERERACIQKSGGLKTYEEVQLWKQKCDVEAELANDTAWQEWQLLCDERCVETAEECQVNLKKAEVKKMRYNYLKLSIPKLRDEVNELRNVPFNPLCEACANNPIHCRRSQLEKELDTVEREWQEFESEDHIDQEISRWTRSYAVMTKIESMEAAMIIRKTARARLARLVKKIVERIDGDITVRASDMMQLMVDWTALETARVDMERRKETFEKKEKELVTRIEEIQISKQSEAGLGYSSREAIIEAIDGWQYAYQMQSMIENKRDWMYTEMDAWAIAVSQWEAWNKMQGQIEEFARIREQAERVCATLKMRVAVADELRVAEWLAAERSVRYYRAKKEWQQICTYQHIAYIRYKQTAAELSKLRDELRRTETSLNAAKKAAEWREAHEKRVSGYERTWETWRVKRDILQSTYQRLIGTKDDKDTFKEWIYESFAIPLLEQYVNSFLAESTGSALSIEIIYTSKSLEFVVYDRGNRTTFGLSSGFQQFMIGLALRLALTRLGGRGHRFRTLIIDEGFVACDTDNVQNAREILQNMMDKGGFRHILLATHLDTIKDMIGRKIHIEREGGFSRLRVGGRLEFTHRDAADKPKRGRPKKGENK